MQAMKCDRCGCFYERYGSRDQANAMFIQNRDVAGRAKCDVAYDLCPRCMSEAQEWIEAGRKKEEIT